jgi:predicted nuclease with TOPRIM domain
MDQPNELIERLQGEEATLHERIERLEREAISAKSGIRQYRHQRVDQLRQRHGHLRERVRRIEAHAQEGWDAIRPEAERLYLELRDAHAIADRTFH